MSFVQRVPASPEMMTRSDTFTCAGSSAFRPDRPAGGPCRSCCAPRRAAACRKCPAGGGAGFAAEGAFIEVGVFDPVRVFVFGHRCYLALIWYTRPVSDSPAGQSLRLVR